HLPVATTAVRSVTLYDTIPAAFELYEPHFVVLWRMRARLISTFDCSFAISDFTRRSFIDAFRLHPRHVLTVGTGVPQPAGFGEITDDGAGAGFVLYTGGTTDPRKNLARLVRAFAGAAAEHPQLELVIASRISARAQAELEDVARSAGIADRLRFTGYIS